MNEIEIENAAHSIEIDQRVVDEQVLLSKGFKCKKGVQNITTMLQIECDLEEKLHKQRM